MSEYATTTMYIMFWLLLASIVILPLRWALGSFLLLTFIDISGPQFASASQIGFENFIKIIVVPLILVFRMRLAPLWLRVPHFFGFFVALLIYAALASLWTSYPLSAAKMLGYLTSYCISFLVLGYAFKRGLTHVRTVLFVLWGALVLAYLQTYLLGNPFGTDPYGISFRFTSFSSPQSFAAFLVVCVNILLYARVCSGLKIISVFGAVIALIMSGSRYCFISMIISFIIYGAIKLLSCKNFDQFTLRWALLVLVGLPIVSGIAITPLFTANKISDNRIMELYQAFREDSGLASVGTYNWRVGMYRTALDQIIHESTTFEVILGHGTSNSANVALRYSERYEPETIDANRVMHNEFLRALYEWGMGGFGILVAFLLSLMYSLTRLAIRNLMIAAPVIGVLPLLFSGLMIENILAGAGTPVGIGLTLVITYAYYYAVDNCRTSYQTASNLKARSVHLPAS